MKLKEGTIRIPKLINIDYHWKKISHFTKDIIFRDIVINDIKKFINRRVNDNPHLKYMKYIPDLPFWKYTSNCIQFKKYNSNNPKDINFYRIAKGCHWMQNAFLYLINKLEPKQKWLILYGNKHSCIINEKKTIIIDFFAKPLQYKNGNECLKAVFS